jgi:hypothetical protein
VAFVAVIIAGASLMQKRKTLELVVVIAVLFETGKSKRHLGVA